MENRIGPATPAVADASVSPRAAAARAVQFYEDDEFLCAAAGQQDAGTARQYGGLGLGLSVVRYLVEAHGGTVAVESEGEGQGATFIVTLPLMPDEVVASEAEPEPRVALRG